jgi:uncharacterized membrane protein
MAANFNIVPTAILEIETSAGESIKNQVPVALVMLVLSHGPHVRMGLLGERR